MQNFLLLERVLLEILPRELWLAKASDTDGNPIDWRPETKQRRSSS